MGFTGVIVGAGILAAPVTGGASLIPATTMGAAVTSLGALGALRLGMSYGAMKNMAGIQKQLINTTNI